MPNDAATAIIKCNWHRRHVDNDVRAMIRRAIRVAKAVRNTCVL